MDGDRRFVQLEVGVVGVSLVEAVAVFGGNKRRSIAHMLRAAVDRPVIESRSVRAGGGGGTGRIAGIDLHRFRCDRYGAHARAVRRNLVVDGNLVLLPYGVEEVVRILLVGRYLGCDVTRGTILAIISTVIPQEVYCRVFNCRGRVQFIAGFLNSLFMPAFEDIAIAGGRGGDVDGLVDLQRRIGVRCLVKLPALTVLTDNHAGTVIHIPNDKRWGGFFFRFILCNQLDRVFLCRWVGIRVDDFHLRIVAGNGEGFAGENGFAGTFIGEFVVCLIPRANDPAIKHIAFRRRSSCAGGHIGIVQVGLIICRRIGA